MHSTSYVIRFVIIMTAVVALVLALMSSSLKDVHERNESIFNKRAVLNAIADKLDQPVDAMEDQEVIDLFEAQIEQKVLDMTGEEISGILAEKVDMKKEKKKPEAERKLPLYIFTSGGDKTYIATVRGNGLWDEIWGFIALKSDFNTISGTSFDHTGETPGLGAEIKDNKNFPASFVGKKLYSADGTYTSITVKKGGAKDPVHQVDGISGATITCDGVTEMMKRGMKYYEIYFNKIKGATSQG